jgi:hypothetical protein
MTKLSEEDKKLLTEVVTARNSSLIEAVKNLETQPLSAEHKEAIQQTLLDEMYEKGLESGDEPNEYGKRLDDLTGKLELL